MHNQKERNVYKNEKKEVWRALQTKHHRIGLFVPILALPVQLFVEKKVVPDLFSVSHLETHLEFHNLAYIAANDKEQNDHDVAEGLAYLNRIALRDLPINCEEGEMQGMLVNRVC